MTVNAIDNLNSDLGEGFGIWRLGDDAAMLQLVTSANIACGSTLVTRQHFVRFATTPSKMMSDRSAELVSDLVKLGDHIDMGPAELTDAVLYQLEP